MQLNSKKASMIVTAVTSLLLSRTMFFFIDDPEGPNLLVVTVAAAIVYGLSLGIYSFLPVEKEEGFKKILLMVVTQIIIVGSLYFFLK